MPYTVWFRYVKVVLHAAAKANLETQTLLGAVGLDSSILEATDARIPHEKVYALWREISRLSGDEAIGLRLVELVEPEALDVVGYAAYSSSNLGEALSRFIRYSRLIHEGVNWTLETKGNVTRITHSVPGIHLPLPGVLCQWVLATVIVNVRRMTGLNLVPFQVGFQHPQPEDISYYRKLFKHP
jgi:hypothetical protein